MRTIWVWLLVGCLSFLAMPAVAQDSPPNAPWGLVVIPQSDQKVLLGWQAPMDGPAVSGYHVYRGVVGAELELIGSVGASDTTFTDSPSAQTEWQPDLVDYVVKAFNAAGESGPSNHGFWLGETACASVTLTLPPLVYLNQKCLGVPIVVGPLGAVCELLFGRGLVCG